MDRRPLDKSANKFSQPKAHMALVGNSKHKAVNFNKPMAETCCVLTSHLKFWSLGAAPLVFFIMICSSAFWNPAC